MAFDPKALARDLQVAVAAGDMCNSYFYATADAAAAVETGGYFTDKRLRKGDSIEAVMARSGTPVKKSYVITAVTTAGVATIALASTAAG